MAGWAWEGKGGGSVRLVPDNGSVIAEGAGTVDVTDRIEDVGGMYNFNPRS